MKPKAHKKDRQFGYVVGTAFAAVGSIWLFRGRFLPIATGCLVAGLALIALAALRPGLLSHPHRLWMRMAEGMSFVMTRVILALVFFLVLTPIALVRRALGSDPLRRRAPRRDTYWTPYPQRQRDPRHFEKMF